MSLHSQSLTLLVFAAVLWAIADRLSQPEGAWKPFARDGLRSLIYDDPHDADGASLLAT